MTTLPPRTNPLPKPPKPLSAEHGLQLAEGKLVVTFHRTCRVPHLEGRSNQLPAGLGNFPLFRVGDYAQNLPSDWKPEGHFIPMYAHEALWMSFWTTDQPVAMLVGAGMVNAVTGTKLEATLAQGPQNYLVAPPQPWLDGFKPTTGERVFQFVAAPLGSGETAEEQILGTAEFGGIQFGVFLPRSPLIQQPRPHEYLTSGGWNLFAGSSHTNTTKRYAMGGTYNAASFSNEAAAMAAPAAGSVSANDVGAMGLGAGGSIEQKIYPDPYLNGRQPSEVWHTEPADKGYVYIVNALRFKAITGHEAPQSPITYATYQANGLPWFGLPDGSWGDVEGGEAIDTLKPVSGAPDPTDASAQSNPSTEKLW